MCKLIYTSSLPWFVLTKIADSLPSTPHGYDRRTKYTGFGNHNSQRKNHLRVNTNNKTNLNHFFVLVTGFPGCTLNIKKYFFFF